MKLTSLFSLAAFVSAIFVAPLGAEEKAAFEVKVPAMKCTGCAWSVTQELKKLDHVSDVYVDAKTKKAIIATDSDAAPDEKTVLSAVKTAGYEASGYTKLKVKFAEAKAALTGEKG
ncbi:MAG: heavy-metal-associated domain-containing protein [Verrucomicrobiales bacterium]|jgi:copper chaperone CopZ|nr:heavy-metal-associated domain-containing protein [Verrucomicrobiales bacterium]MDP4790890.1 heavy-metal-associated domain-containing protein [Verrucomicrobiales bacterium]MDP4938779.1 heavy-metal-associated domain-containing protein [Verrucomicrobiales bacterium]MDP5004893.1 heavy-metal-associated domain-containing protein [Verrucomicrobiales bacterium]